MNPITKVNIIANHVTNGALMKMLFIAKDVIIRIVRAATQVVVVVPDVKIGNAMTVVHPVVDAAKLYVIIVPCHVTIVKNHSAHRVYQLAHHAKKVIVNLLQNLVHIAVIPFVMIVKKHVNAVLTTAVLNVSILIVVNVTTVFVIVALITHVIVVEPKHVSHV